jgi:hypothetical protein
MRVLRLGRPGGLRFARGFCHSSWFKFVSAPLATRMLTSFTLLAITSTPRAVFRSDKWGQSTKMRG